MAAPTRAGPVGGFTPPRPPMRRQRAGWLGKRGLWGAIGNGQWAMGNGRRWSPPARGRRQGEGDLAGVAAHSSPDCPLPTAQRLPIPDRRLPTPSPILPTSPSAIPSDRKDPKPCHTKPAKQRRHRRRAAGLPEAAHRHGPLGAELAQHPATHTTLRLVLELDGEPRRPLHAAHRHLRVGLAARRAPRLQPVCHHRRRMNHLSLCGQR